MYTGRYSCQNLIKLEFPRQIFPKIFKYKFFMKVRPAGAELFHADRQTDKHDEANTRLSQFCEKARKIRLVKYPQFLRGA
jgi:hypothetical protein